MTTYSRKRTLIGFVPLFVLGVLMLPIAGTVTTIHTSIDLLNADRVLRGEIVQLVSRVTVYVLVALGVLLLGREVATVVYVTRFFYVAGVWAVYALTARLYGVMAAMTAAALVLSSFAVNYVASFATSVDTVAPCIVVIFVLLLHAALQRGRAPLFAAAGATLAVGCLAKEVALPFAALPTLLTLAVADYRARADRGRLLALLYAAFVLTYVPWLALVWLKTGSVTALFGLGAPKRVAEFAGGDDESASSGYGALINALVWQLPDTAGTYYRQYLAEYVALAPVMVAALAFIGARAVWFRRGADVMLAACVLLYAPSILVQAIVGERLGQGMAFFYFGYIAIAELTVAVARWMSKIVAARFARPVQYGVVALAAAIMIAVQGFGGSHPAYPLLASGTGATDLGKLSFYRSASIRYGGRISNQADAGLDWVGANLPAGTPLLVDSSFQPAMRLMFASDYPLHDFADLRATGEIRAQLERGGTAPRGRALFALPLSSFMSGPARYRDWYLMHEGELLADIARSGARHIVLGPRHLFVSIYLDAVPWATLRFRNADVAVYTIQPGAAAIERWTIVSSDRAPAVMAEYRQRFPEEFRRFAAFLRRLQMNADDLTTTNYTQYQRRWVMEHIDPNARIAYSNPLGVFLVPEWQNTSWFNQDRSFSAFSGFDYLFIHALRRGNPEFGQLLADLERETPFKSFPRLPAYDFGEGWDVYRIPAAARGSTENAR